MTDKRDIVERLQAQVPQQTPLAVCYLLDEAADTITTLREQLAEARQAFRKYGHHLGACKSNQLENYE